MGITERRQREKEQRRNSIIAAAERVFFSKGVESATMDEVAEKAEISKGLLYVYFQSKEDLYHAIILRGLRLLRLSFQRAVRQQEKGLRKAHAIGQAYVIFAQRHPYYFAGIVYQAAQDTGATEGSYAAACHAERDRIFHLVADAIRCGIEDGSVRPDLDPLETAIMLWGQMHGVIQVASMRTIQDQYQFDFQSLITFAFGFITAALRARQ